MRIAGKQAAELIFGRARIATAIRCGWIAEPIPGALVVRGGPPTPIVDRCGKIIARTDIGFPSIRLGLEAHSRQFHFGPRRERLDEDRDIAAAICGWELTYLGWYATKRPAEVLQIVNELVRERERLFGPPGVG